MESRGLGVVEVKGNGSRVDTSFTAAGENGEAEGVEVTVVNRLKVAGNNVRGDGSVPPVAGSVVGGIPPVAVVSSGDT
jgi:hypothetical protein